MYDVLAAVRAYFVSLTAITNQVSTRVYVAGIPRTEQPNMPRKVIGLYSSGGPGMDRDVPEGRVTVQCRCYGASSVQAWEVATAVLGAVHRAHHQTPLAGKQLLTIMNESHPADFVEPSTFWPGVMFNLSIHYVTDTMT